MKRTFAQLAPPPSLTGATSVIYTVSAKQLTKDDFGIHYIRWPYDPNPINPQGVAVFWPDTQAAGIARCFDPNWHGRWDSSSQRWFGGTMRPDGTFDFSMIDNVLSQYAAKGFKIVLNLGALTYSALTADNNGTGLNMFGHDPSSPQGQTDFLNYLNGLLPHISGKVYAYEPYGEPSGIMNSTATGGLGWSLAKLSNVVAQYQRIAFLLVKKYDPTATVVSTPYQGGEGVLAGQMFAADASGIAIDGSTGAGTVGAQYFDVIGHHFYGALANQNWDRSGIDYNGSIITRTMLTYAGQLNWAIALNNLQSKPVWNTEFHASGSSLYRFQGQSRSYSDRVLRQLLFGSIACGFTKHLIYAADHSNLGLWDGSSPTNQFNATSATAANVFASIINVLVAQPISAGFAYYASEESPRPFVHEGMPVRKPADASGVFLDL